jgi:hypothetical protein
MAVATEEIQDKILARFRREFSLHKLLAEQENIFSVYNLNGRVIRRTEREDRDFFMIAIDMPDLSSLYPGTCDRHFSIDKWYDIRRTGHDFRPMHYTERYTQDSGKVVCIHAFLDQQGVYLYHKINDESQESKEVAEWELHLRQNLARVLTVIQPILNERNQLYFEESQRSHALLVHLDTLNLYFEAQRAEYIDKAREFIDSRMRAEVYGDITCDTQRVFVEKILSQLLLTLTMNIPDPKSASIESESIFASECVDFSEPITTVTISDKPVTSQDMLNELYEQYKECSVSESSVDVDMDIDMIISKRILIAQMKTCLIECSNLTIDTACRIDDLQLRITLLKMVMNTQLTVFEKIFPRLSFADQHLFFEGLYLQLLKTDAKTLLPYIEIMNYLYDVSEEYRSIILKWNDKPISIKINSKYESGSMLGHFFVCQNLTGFEMLVRHGVPVNAWGVTIKEVRINILEMIEISSGLNEYPYLELLHTYRRGINLFSRPEDVSDSRRLVIKNHPMIKRNKELGIPVVILRSDTHIQDMMKKLITRQHAAYDLYWPEMPLETMLTFLTEIYECPELYLQFMAIPSMEPRRLFCNTQKQAKQQVHALKDFCQKTSMFVCLVLYPDPDKCSFSEAEKTLLMTRIQASYDVLMQKIENLNRQDFDTIWKSLAIQPERHHREGDFIDAYDKCSACEESLRMRWLTHETERNDLVPQLQAVYLQQMESLGCHISRSKVLPDKENFKKLYQVVLQKVAMLKNYEPVTTVRQRKRTP